MRNRFALIAVVLTILPISLSIKTNVSAQEFLDLREVSAFVEHNPAFCEFPLTVECRVKLAAHDNYNIIIANETKRSATHWELFTMPRTGYLTLYAPGFSPDHVRTERNVADDQWHHLAAVIGKTEIGLYVDGEKVEQIPIKAPQKQGPADRLTIGQLVEGGFNCNGTVAEIRISKGARKINAETPMQSDENTIALWRFEKESEPGVYADLSGNGNRVSAAESVALGIVEEKNITASFIPLPAPKDVNPAKQAARKTINDLQLQTAKTDTLRDTIWQEWLYDFENWNKIEYADKRHIWFDNRAKIPEQVFDRHSLVLPEDGGPAGTAIRRTEALLQNLGNTHADLDLSKQQDDLAKLKQAYNNTKPAKNDPAQLGFYMACCVIRRQIVLANPLLDFDDLLCIVRGTYAGSVRSNPGTMDMQGGHFANQYFGFNAIPGGGLYVVKGWKGNAAPTVTNLLENSPVQNGRYKGQKLNRGAFCTPDVDFDGSRISFSWCGNTDHKLIFSRERLWHVFTVNADGSNLTQLTDGAYDDFDSCWLPDGRLAFISERRGGFIRCFSGLRVPQYSLFSVKDDGSDMIPLSYYETSEWNPTVNNDGKIVYTRWDYTDRENCLGSRFWICGPDGTDPRAPHGNYPHPWHTFDDHPNKQYDSRMGAPRTETSIRSIPGSSLYLFTAAPHHGDIDGSLCMLNLRIPDDGHMSQITRITPEELFPESEFSMRSHFKYKTPWPLSEDYYIVNCWENLVLLDRFGNKELICHLREMPCKHDDRFRVFEPIPLRPRERPPILPTLTNQGEDAIAADDPAAPKATLAVMNVYESDQPMPKGVKIKWLRVVHNILKSDPEMGVPMVGYEREATPRIPLGIVPVEEDGSAYFEAPVAKELIFQILDENKMAVQSMRSVAYVHPGEQLSCVGCHENTSHAGAVRAMPLAMQRQPSKLEPEFDPIEPISYYRQIKPIFKKYCIDCHEKKENAGPTDLSYEALKEDTFWFAGGMLGTVNTDYSGVHGGTRSIPGRFGARYCKLGQTLRSDTHREAVPDDVRRMINLWLDCNSLRLTAFHRVEEQLRGELVWPYLDVDPRNPVGVEGTEPRLERHFWHQNLEGPHPYLCSSHQENKVFLVDRSGKIRWENPAQNPQDSWVLDNGNVLVACLHQVYEITPDIKAGRGGTVVWEYKTQAPNEIPTCQPLPNGKILIGIVGECRLIEVDRNGKITHEVKLETSVKEPHAQFRLCRKTLEGTYLIPFTAEGTVREYDAKGKVIREFPRTITSPIGVLRLPDGNTLISGGSRVIEYAPNNKVVWEIGPNDIPDIAVGTLAGLQRLENGNTIICNWGASPRDGKIGAHIFEISLDKYVTWYVERTDFGRTASCQILDDNFKPQKELKIWR